MFNYTSLKNILYCGVPRMSSGCVVLRCVGRVSGFQKLSRGFRRLVALLPSLPPFVVSWTASVEPAISLRHPTASLTTRAFYGGESGPPRGQRSLYFFLSGLILSLSLSLSLSTAPPPFNENPAFPYQRVPSGLPEPVTQSEQQGIFIGVDSFIGNDG